MKRWLRRNIRAALWVHALFLLVLVVGWSPSVISRAAEIVCFTLFLPHTLLAFSLGGFSDAAPNHIVFSAVFGAVVAFPCSLVYASVFHWSAAALHRLRSRPRKRLTRRCSLYLGISVDFVEA
jgi:hypothetical protein